MDAVKNDELAELDFTPENVIFPELTKLDRCDRCSGAALSMVQVSHTLPMLNLCGHHFRKYRAHFDEMGYSYLLNDDVRRDALFELPAKEGAHKPYADME
jgi:hypothetical protein